METLGHVLFVPNWYNVAAVSLAPLILAPMSMWFVWSSSTAPTWKLRMLWLYLSSCAWLACLPSSKDWSNAVDGLSSLVLLAAVLIMTTTVYYRIWRRKVKLKGLSFE